MDVVTLKNGSKIQGTVISQTRTIITIRDESGKVSQINKSQLKRIQFQIPVEDKSKAERQKKILEERERAKEQERLRKEKLKQEEQRREAEALQRKKEIESKEKAPSSSKNVISPSSKATGRHWGLSVLDGTAVLTALYGLDLYFQKSKQSIVFSRNPITRTVVATAYEHQGGITGLTLNQKKPGLITLESPLSQLEK